MTYSISNIEYFKIIDEETGAIYYGSDQEWYPKRRQRLAGCGPCSVSNVIHYLSNAGEDQALNTTCSKSDYLSLMSEIWNYVTPGPMGVSSTKMLCDGVAQYIQTKNILLEMRSIDVPKDINLRPSVSQISEFLIAALEKDLPVAFLNLEHGTVKNLDSWHWVTIFRITVSSDQNNISADILDAGQIKQINLSDWILTTKKGGGFVSFIDKRKKQATQ